MKALVVYESMFGNTEAVAKAVADGLAESMDVDVHDVSRGAPAATEDVDLVVVGGPTHAFSMSRPSTRADAVRQGAAADRRATGIREWLADQATASHQAPIATFDTRVAKVRRLPGSAARKAMRTARAQGFNPVQCTSFYVADVAGPLLDGEVARARDWGRRLASAMSPVRS